MKNKEIFICVVILIIIYTLYRCFWDATVPQLSGLNGKYYKVRKGSLKMQQLKADILANLELQLDTLIKTINDTNIESIDKVAAKRLKDKWKNVKIRETGKMESDAAYVLGKGHSFRMCLQEGPFTGNIEHKNLITYVAIHELAHIMSVSYGHGKEFQKNFKDLLQVADNTVFFNPYTKKNEKIYNRIDFASTPDNFCGVNITSSPY